jgi:hypothetical protein
MTGVLKAMSLPVSHLMKIKTAFLQKYKYDYTYINSAGTVTAKSTYSIPNSWIVDGVNNSVSSKFAHTLTSCR